MSTNLQLVINVDLSYADISGIYEALPVEQVLAANANITLKGSNNLKYLERVFWFKTDSLDVSDNDTTTDLRVAVNSTAFAAALQSCIDTGEVTELSELPVVFQTPSPANIKDESGTQGTQGITTWQSGAMPQIAGPVPGYQQKNQLKYDIVRYIAYQLTGGYTNSDIFSNENELLSTVAGHLDSSDAGVLKTVVDQLGTDTTTQGSYSDPDASNNFSKIVAAVKDNDSAAAGSAGYNEMQSHKPWEYVGVTNAPQAPGGTGGEFTNTSDNLVGVIIKDLLVEHQIQNIGEFLETGDYLQPADASGGEWQFIRVEPGTGKSGPDKISKVFKRKSAIDPDTEFVDAVAGHYYDGCGNSVDCGTRGGKNVIGKFQDGHKFNIKIIFRRIAQKTHDGDKEEITQQPNSDTTSSNIAIDGSNVDSSSVAGGLNKVGDRSYLLQFEFTNKN